MLKWFCIILGVINVIACRKHSESHEEHKGRHLTIEIRPHLKAAANILRKGSWEKEAKTQRTTSTRRSKSTKKHHHKAKKAKQLYTEENWNTRNLYTEEDSNTRNSYTPQELSIPDVIVTTEESVEEFTTTERTLLKYKKIQKPPSRSVDTYDWEVWCKLQPVSYNCDGTGTTKEKFYFDTKRKTCTRSEVSNCIHNINKFNDFMTCYNQCKEYESRISEEDNPDVACRLQPEFGDCNDYSPMYYYDMNAGKCKGFSYSGCGGNKNRFQTIAQCAIACGSVVKYVPSH